MELIKELTGWRISSTEIMLSNIIGTLPKEYDNPVEKVRKTSGYLDDTKKALVTTTDTVVKEGNTDMVEKKEKKPNVAKESITTPISGKKKIDTVNKTEKSQASNKTVDTPKSNKTDTVKSLDKSRSTQITDTENTVNTVNKERSISRTNLSNKSTRIENPVEIDTCKDNSSISVLSGHGESLSSVTTYQQRITRKKKIKKTSDSLIMRKDTIQETDNPRKMEKIGYYT